jgi:hypothetical protein
VSTDAVNRAPRTSYGEVTGITQTVRNFGASLGLAILGTILVTENTSNIESSLEAAGLPAARAEQVADAVSHAGGGSSGAFASRAGGKAKEIFAEVQHDFALSSRTVFYIMAGVMLVSFVVAVAGMPAGRAVEPEPEPALEPEPAPPG